MCERDIQIKYRPVVLKLFYVIHPTIRTRLWRGGGETRVRGWKRFKFKEKRDWGQIHGFGGLRRSQLKNDSRTAAEVVVQPPARHGGEGSELDGIHGVRLR